MASKLKQSVVELSPSIIIWGEAYGSYNQYYDNYPSVDVNSIYFMSKPRFEYYTFFRFMPSVRTYYKILKAINKLKIGSFYIKDKNTMQVVGETILTAENEGFKDIIAFLKRKQYIKKEDSISDIRYWESYYLQKPPPFGLHIKALNATVNGKDKFLLDNALHELKKLADIYVRSKITRFIVILAFLITFLSIFIIVWSHHYM